MTGYNKVIKMPDDENLKRSLESIGITLGTRIKVKGIAPGGDPMTVSVHGVDYAVRKELMNSIVTSLETT